MNYLTFADLVARGIVSNRTTLMRWQRDQGFPTGQLNGPNSRRFSEDEILNWLASRPKQSDSKVARRRLGKPAAVSADRTAAS